MYQRADGAATSLTAEAIVKFGVIVKIEKGLSPSRIKDVNYSLSSGPGHKEGKSPSRSRQP
jgi:hypothetical protein